MHNFKNLLLLFIVFCTINLCQLKSQSEPTWSIPIENKEFNFHQDEWGSVIITEKGKIQSLNPKTGEQNWSIVNGTEKITVTRVENTPLGIIEGQKLQLFDLQTGEVYLEDSGTSVSFKNHEAFLDKGKLLIDYRKDDEPMIAVVDLSDYNNSILAPIRTKGGLFSGNLRLPSSNGAVFKNKKILNCLNTDGVSSEYDSGEKSMNIIGGTDSGIATLVIKYKTFRGINMSTCEVLWEHKADKQPNYFVNDAKGVVLLKRKKTVQALDMETGEMLYTLELNKSFSGDPFFIDDHLYYPDGSNLEKYDVRSGELIAEKEFDGYVENIQWIDDSYYVTTGGKLNKINLETLETGFDKGLGNASIVWKKKKDNLSYYLTQGEGKYNLYCYENDMKQLWSSSVAGLIFKDIFFTKNEVVVATEKELKSIKNSDGKKLWSYKSNFNVAVSPNLDGSKYYGIVSSYSFHVDTESGEFTALPKFKLKDFKANEAQSHILVSDNSYIMKSGNNFYIRDLNGEEIVTKHYKRHSNASRWLKAAAAVSQVGAVATGNAAEVVQVSDGAGNVVHQGSMYDNGAFTRSMDDARRRIANSSDLNLPFVFTKNENKKKVFLFIDPLTGDEYKSIEVREEEPDFTVDTYDGILFYKNVKSDRFEAHMLDN